MVLRESVIELNTVEYAPNGNIVLREKHDGYTRIKVFSGEYSFATDHWVNCHDEIYCELCGGTVDKQFHYREGRTYVCSRCRNKIKKKETILKRAAAVENVVDNKKEKQFEKATVGVLKQTKKPDKYENAVRIAGKYYEEYGSVPETMVAIELARLGYAFIPQKKIRRYRVDFFIPDRKMIVEVDGETFHTDSKKREVRDDNIRDTVGWDWKIIHIPAERISKQITKLQKVINALTTL